MLLYLTDIFFFVVLCCFVICDQLSGKHKK